MNILYSDQTHDERLYNSVFLAGPSPRGDRDPALNWRLKAVEIFEKIDTDLNIQGLTLLIPLPASGIVADYDVQIEWEQRYLHLSRVVMFWVPRDLIKLPAFTTNVEFGQYVHTPKIIYGRPDNSPKNNYLDKLFKMYHSDQTIHTTLEDTIKATIIKLLR